MNSPARKARLKAQRIQNWTETQQKWHFHFLKTPDPTPKQILDFLYDLPYQKINNRLKHWKIMEEGHWAISNYGDMILLEDTYANHYKAGLFIKFNPVKAKSKTRYLGSVLKNYWGKRTMLMPHKLVAKYFIGPRPDDMTINHKNLNKHDNHVWNLEYISLSKNIEHALKKGDFGQFEPQKVRQLRKLLKNQDKNGLSQRDIALICECSVSTVSRYSLKELIRSDVK